MGTLAKICASLLGCTALTTSALAQAPEIAVEQPLGTNLTDGGTKSFGTVTVGSNKSLVFSIKNTGDADLTGLAITKGGHHAADFTLTAKPSAPLSGPGGMTTFTVRFAPSGVGTRTAAIHIANNDSDETSFDINLTGTATLTKSIGAVWFIGDSITQSNGDGDGNSSPRKALYDLLMANGYSFTFTGHYTANVDGLPATGDTPETNLYQYHSGISGSVIGDDWGGRVGMTQNTPSFWTNGRLATVKPSVILIMLGTNDVDQNLDLANAPARLTALVNAIYAQPGVGTPRVMVASIPPNRTSADDPAHTATFNAAVPGVVSAQRALGRNVSFVNQFTPLENAYATNMAGDNLHTNATGNVTLAQQWFNAIASVPPSAPTISVAQPANTLLVSDSSSVNFGSSPSDKSVTLTFTLKNTGTATMSGIKASKDGTDAADYVISPAPASSIAASSSTSFKVNFTPKAAGTRVATLHIASNTLTNNPFNIELTGTMTGSTTYTLPATNRGWFDQNGFHNSNHNYLTGYCAAKETRAFFTFALPILAAREALVSAELRLANPALGFSSPDATESLQIHAVSTPIDTLVAASDPLASFNDLGDGPVLGGPFSASAVHNGTTLVLPMNASFLALANQQAGTTLALGSALTTLSRIDAINEAVFAGTNDGVLADTQLVLVTIRSDAALRAWRQTHFANPDSIGDGADLVDFDQDGLANLIEFAFGLSPKQSDAGGLPQPQQTAGNLVMNFTQPAGVTGITYGAEWSPTLLSESWTPLADAGTPPLHSFSLPMGTAPQLYMRLRITSP